MTVIFEYLHKVRVCFTSIAIYIFQMFCITDPNDSNEEVVTDIHRVE